MQLHKGRSRAWLSRGRKALPSRPAADHAHRLTPPVEQDLPQIGRVLQFAGYDLDTMLADRHRGSPSLDTAICPQCTKRDDHWKPALRSRPIFFQAHSIQHQNAPVLLPDDRLTLPCRERASSVRDPCGPGWSLQALPAAMGATGARQRTTRLAQQRTTSQEAPRYKAKPFSQSLQLWS